jgi:hypothetical protein
VRPQMSCELPQCSHVLSRMANYIPLRYLLIFVPALRKSEFGRKSEMVASLSRKPVHAYQRWPSALYGWWWLAQGCPLPPPTLMTFAVDWQRHVDVPT